MTKTPSLDEALAAFGQDRSLIYKAFQVFHGDPCDEMVTIGQVVDFVARRPMPAGSKGPDVYDRIAAILGMERHQTKVMVHHHCYSRTSPSKQHRQEF